MTPTARGQILHRLADLIETYADRLIRVEVTDNGKLINEISAQVRYLPQYFRYFGGLADKIEGSVLPIDKAETFNFTRHEPLGSASRSPPGIRPCCSRQQAGPGLAAGNTFVVKPSEYTSASALELATLFEEAGLPQGVVNVVTGYADVGAAWWRIPRLPRSPSPAAR